MSPRLDVRTFFALPSVVPRIGACHRAAVEHDVGFFRYSVNQAVPWSSAKPPTSRPSRVVGSCDVFPVRRSMAVVRSGGMSFLPEVRISATGVPAAFLPTSSVDGAEIPDCSL
ncbi:hypothetical protein [Patulibacter minatonensis]|uniref:hypothetical protein n=1 Tax=Patulibacter minatonensis TaxID=298163 RepID=UPI00047E0B75|nr:hypothetical protein [Patulibacter minatonensis]